MLVGNRLHKIGTEKGGDEEKGAINRAVEGNHRFRVKICGPQKDVFNMLNARPDIAAVEQLDVRDGEAFTYIVESANGLDMRKGLFYALAERGWAMIGLEAMGMSLEDVFISVVDGANGMTKKGGKSRKGARDAKGVERDIAQAILDATAEKQKNIAPYAGDED